MKPKQSIKCAFSVYLSIGFAVFMSIASMIASAHYSPNSTAMQFMPMATGASWIIAILAVIRSGDKANIKLPHFWYWRL